MIKAILLLKKKPGMSREEFIDYYENQHAPLGMRMMKGQKRYIRRYIAPTGNVLPETDIQPGFDVMTEVWFEDRAAFEENARATSEPSVAAALAADEENLFDRSRHIMVLVEERESIIDGDPSHTG